MSEQKMDAELAAFEAAYAEAVESGWTSTKDLARQIWQQARASLPVGVPDGMSLREAFECGGVAQEQFAKGWNACCEYVQSFSCLNNQIQDDLVFLADYIWRDSCGLSMPNYLALGRYPLDVAKKVLDAPAAPTVKAEQVRLPERKRTDHLTKDAKTMTPVRAAIEAYNRALDDVAALNSIPAPSLPAAESAPGDEPDITTKHGYPAYSVAQHERIIAALSAQHASTGVYSADPLACSGCASGCLRCRAEPAQQAGAVSVPAQAVVYANELASMALNGAGYDSIIRTAKALRALLSSSERGGEA